MRRVRRALMFALWLPAYVACGAIIGAVEACAVLFDEMFQCEE